MAETDPIPVSGYTVQYIHVALVIYHDFYIFFYHATLIPIQQFSSHFNLTFLLVSLPILDGCASNLTQFFGVIFHIYNSLFWIILWIYGVIMTLKEVEWYCRSCSTVLEHYKVVSLLCFIFVFFSWVLYLYLCPCLQQANQESNINFRL